MRTLIYLVFLGIASFSTRLGYCGLEAADARRGRSMEDMSEVLYLPSGQGITFLSFGYRNTLADLLWFKTISYFGKHYAGDKNYRWLNHMCNLVADLDPKAAHVYEFCGTMLSWELNQAPAAVEILTRGVSALPENWRLRYLRGFTSMYFLHDEERARDDFIAASHLPEADPFVAKLAARKMVDTDSPQAAIGFLIEMIRNTRDQSVKSALVNRLRETQYEWDLRRLEGAVRAFRAAHDAPPASLEALADSTLPAKDPFGGVYRISPDDGSVTSTSNHPRRKSNKKKVTQ